MSDINLVELTVCMHRAFIWCGPSSLAHIFTHANLYLVNQAYRDQSFSSLHLKIIKLSIKLHKLDGTWIWYCNTINKNTTCLFMLLNSYIIPSGTGRFWPFGISLKTLSALKPSSWIVPIHESSTTSKPAHLTRHTFNVLQASVTVMVLLHLPMVWSHLWFTNAHDKRSKSLCAGGLWVYLTNSSP